MSDSKDRRRMFVAAPVAPLNSEPRISSPQVSQRLGGHPLDILDRREDWMHVRGEDAYEGWIHRGFILSTEMREDSGEAGSRFCSLGCTTLGLDGRRRVLPLGAWLQSAERCVDGEVIEETAMARRFPPNAAATVLTAIGFFEGTSYEWGGITPWGADCSGLVQTAFWVHGLQLPRDASQQAVTGTDAGRDPRACEAGDLLFFSDRSDQKITHVGIAIGDGRMVHSGLGRGGYAVESFTAETADEYTRALASRFLFARRPSFPG